MDWNPKNELDDNFFEVAKKAYDGDPYWIPENISSVRKQFSESNDYFKSCNAWVGIEADKARLAGFYNPAIEVEGKKVAFFGFWESIDELDPNIKLFSDFLKWAKTKNVDKVYGPINFSTYGPYRIKTNYRDDEGCFQGEPYSPPYYMKLMDGLGFDVAKRFYSQESSFKYLFQMKRLYSAALDPIYERFEFVDLSKEMWMAKLPDLYELVDNIFKENFAYTSISKETFMAACGKPFAQKFCSKSSCMVFEKSTGKVASFFLAYPDYGELLRQGNPNRIDINDIDYDKHFPLLKKPPLCGKTSGVAPEFRKWGLHSCMSVHSGERSLSHYAYPIACLIREDNVSGRFMKEITEYERTYSLYSKDL